MSSKPHFPALAAAAAVLDGAQAQPWTVSKPLEVIHSKRLTLPFIPQSRTCHSNRLYEAIAIVSTAILCSFFLMSSGSSQYPSKICLFILSYNDEASLRLNLPLWRPFISSYIVALDDRTSDLSEFVVAEQLRDIPGRVLRINTAPFYDNVSLHPFGARLSVAIENALAYLPEVDRILLARFLIKKTMNCKNLTISLFL
jgi:hypothetical protein